MPQIIAGCFPDRRPELPLHDDELLPRARRGSKSESRAFTLRRLVQSYWSDWVLILGLWALLFVLNRSPGHKREFSLKELSIQHSFAEHERVPPFLLACVSFIIPCGLLVLLAVIVARNAWDFHNAVCGLGMAWTMTGVVTQIIKMMVGRPRPDLIARCLPRPGSVDHPVFGLSTFEICTTTDKLRLNDGFKSFPSGHSSLSFAGLGFLALYLAGKMHLWDAYGHRNRAWFALCPLLFAIMVALSRTMDNRHHWQDIVVGSCLGFIIAFIAYRTYFPSLGHAACHLPLLPRPSSSELAGDDYEADLSTSPHGVRLLPDEQGVPRQSEEEAAWRNNGAEN